jgi:hypothetical protein
VDFPEFNNDEEMAEWFEAHDIGAEQLDIASEVVIASDVEVSVGGMIYAVQGSSTSAAVTVAGDRNREITPAGAR